MGHMKGDGDLRRLNTNVPYAPHLSGFIRIHNRLEENACLGSQNQK